MTPAHADRRRADAAGDRDQFIPARKADILDALVADGDLGAPGARDDPHMPGLRDVSRLIAAILHYEYFATLERLRDDYFYFNPEIEPHAQFSTDARERAYADLVASMMQALGEANFVELSHAEIARAHRERTSTRVEIEAPVDDYRDVRVFRRGHHHQTIVHAEWLGLRRRKTEELVYDDVVLFVAIKSEADIVSSRERARLAQRKIRPGSVLMKYFRNVAAVDINALFPNVRVVMSLRDKLFLSGPALLGGIPILLKLVSTLTVLILVIGFYLGLSAAVKDDQLTIAFAAVSALAALGGFIMRQWLRYRHQSLKYQKELTDNIYFRNVNNNAGMFDSLIGAAEDQEGKEVLLAYTFLCAAKEPLTQAELEERVEAWLQQGFGIEVRFMVTEALARLTRLGLLTRSGERLSVAPPVAALRVLEGRWSSFFRAESALATA
jgi:hypothetical protein